MMDEFITGILRREGWDTYTDHPADRGGPTKWGITQRAYASYVGLPIDQVDVRRIDEERARDFYEVVYITKPNFYKIVNKNLRELVVDCGVNHGPTRAARWLQDAVFTTVDGKVGPLTIAALEEFDPIEPWLRIIATRTSFYGHLVTKDPSQAAFAHGWANRAAGFLLAAANRIAADKPVV